MMALQPREEVLMSYVARLDRRSQAQASPKGVAT